MYIMRAYICILYILYIFIIYTRSIMRAFAFYMRMPLLLLYAKALCFVIVIRDIF